MQRSVVLVDAGGVGSRFAHIFREHGWSPIAVSSASTVPDFVVHNFRQRDYDQVLHFEELGEGLVDRLAGMHVAAVIPVFETAVELADLLAERLGVPGNGTALSRCRRHKGAMLGMAIVAALLLVAFAVAEGGVLVTRGVGRMGPSEQAQQEGHKGPEREDASFVCLG